MTTAERCPVGAADLRPADRDRFRALLRRQAATVTVVTTAVPGVEASAQPGGRGEPVRAGFTATSFTSVSLEPLLVSFCLGNASSSWPVFARAEHVAVHLLGAHQREAARVFATSGVDRFTAYPAWTTGPFDLPLLTGVLARLLCRVTHRVPVGDHTLFLAEPLALGGGDDGDPLIHHRGGFTTTCPPEPA